MAVPEQGQTAIPIDTAAPGGQLLDSIPWGLAPDYARKIARGFCRDGFAHLADDVTQEAMIRLFNNRTRIRTSWKGFLRTTVANAARDLIGREMREIESRRKVQQDREALDGATCSEGGVPDLVAMAELEEELEAALTKLDERFGEGTRAIIELRAQRIPWGEISEALDIPLRTCSDHHGKAAMWLRKQLSLAPGKGGDHE